MFRGYTVFNMKIYGSRSSSQSQLLDDGKIHILPSKSLASCGTKYLSDAIRLGSTKAITWVEQLISRVSCVNGLYLPVKYMGSNVGKTIINHPFGNGLYHLFMVMTGGLFIIVLTTLYTGWWFGTCMNFMTFHMLGMSSSQLTNSYFSEW